ncbi:Protein of unknown function [Streptomyces sp. WMMB 714]|jgi:hypothetical protein|uniref:LmeA family phospholipid-binding protein n=1 Tax=Streptomyces sp. WMMB 714 TaxID=1286822 RepID=UPI0005F886B7|nr:DUF2993 domain-containing protein [Streptomyces sp. WMMB 714]SCK50315.1 Protein of unknown function [Streptomyces sp. WMMB 714]
MRVLRRGLLVLLVLAVLFVGADRLAVKLAEDEAAERIKGADGVSSSTDASVDIKGFPFLTQIAGRELEQIDAELNGMKAGPGDALTVSRVDARLKNVRIGSDYSSAVAETASGSAFVSYKELTKAAHEGVRVSYGGKDENGKGRVKVSAGITLLGQTFERSVTSTVSVSKGDIVELHADEVPGDGIPGLEGAIRQRIDFARKIAGLPPGLELERVEATKKGIELSVRGSDLELSE